MCEGTGLVSRPPGVPGDVKEWSSNATAHSCPSCSGRGVLWHQAEAVPPWVREITLEWRADVERVASYDGLNMSLMTHDRYAKINIPSLVPVNHVLVNGVWYDRCDEYSTRKNQEEWNRLQTDGPRVRH